MTTNTPCICKSMNHNPVTKPYTGCWSKTHDAYWAGSCSCTVHDSENEGAQS